jgi:zinc protease
MFAREHENLIPFRVEDSSTRGSKPLSGKRSPKLELRIALPGARASTLLFFVLAFALVFPTHCEAGLKEQVFETRLSNGMRVILLENHKTPMVTFQVWYRVGSRNEEWGKSGLSHLLEHLMFKGTKNVSAEQFIRTIQENGGNYNAFTSEDFTGYFEDLSTDRVHVALDLEADRMQNVVFTDEEFNTERMVVLEERRLRTDDNPQAYLIEQINAAAFQAQPYHWPTIGWADDLARLTPEDARRYYQLYYNPKNAFIVAVGDFKRDELLAGIEKAFGSISKGTEPPRYQYKDPPQMGERRVYARRDAQVPAVAMAFHVPNISDLDSYVLDVISTILSGGKSSRLYERLILKDRLAISADAQNQLLSVDPNLFYVFAELLPGKDVAEVEKAMEQELERLRTEPVGERELQKAKNQLEAAFVFQQDSLFVQAMLLARHEIVGTWKTVDDYIPSIRKVTPEDIQRVAGRYLVPDKRTVGVLVPISPGAEKPGPGPAPFKEGFIRNSGEGR